MAVMFDGATARTVQSLCHTVPGARYVCMYVTSYNTCMLLAPGGQAVTPSLKFAFDNISYHRVG